MIGIGTDIVSVKRFKGIEKKRAMLEKIFTEKEIAYALSKAVSAKNFKGYTILLSIAHETDYAVSSALVTDTQI